MTGKMAACLLGVAVVAGGVGGGAGWVLGRPSGVIEMLPDHVPFAETCRKHGARVEVGVTAIEFNGEGEGAVSVTDATLADLAAQHVNSSDPIRRLKLENTQITDAGLAHLKSDGTATGQAEAFDRLEQLELVNCPNLSDACLEHLKAKTWLRILTISGCDRITKEGTESLKQAFAEIGKRRTLLVTHR